MKHSIPEEFKNPAQSTLTFIKMFARNYRAVQLSTGEYAEIILS